ncbi:hypothetical protein [Halostagnicola sp. A-GB9-2]|uniref:hypothetical protein n=1 Tax=Halostagnicola sp. A-GB9-2 TaxID=3048066 RepID=UPI0024BF3595|nr:hypothetical protein [Halostagnicola sp. A-GB9-2]MDJ1433610.1 hypothetical protein [Halostagnicola sp. A-GB9-2]
MTDPFERILRPEHVGENRCWPCTIVNTAILALVVAILTLRRRLAAGAVLALTGTATIVFRGYLVPYTPRFAPRLAAGLPGEPFGHDREGSLADSRGVNPSESIGTAEVGNASKSTPPSGEDIIAALLESGVVVPDGEEFVLEDSFRREWRGEIERLRAGSPAELAVVADDLTSQSVETRSERTWGRPHVVLDGPGGIVSFHEPVVLAELGAARALESRLDDTTVRLAAGRPLRPFLRECPRCDGELIVTQRTCCGEVTPIGSSPAEKLVCEVCEATLFAYE